MQVQGEMYDSISNCNYIEFNYLFPHFLTSCLLPGKVKLNLQKSAVLFLLLCYIVLSALWPEFFAYSDLKKLSISLNMYYISKYLGKW